MADILQDLPIRAPVERVFWAVSSPEGLDQWWTTRSAGRPALGETYELWFAPEYDWRARVVRCVGVREFALQMTASDGDWLGTRVAFAIEATDSGARLQFQHTGWNNANEHYRISCHCWAMYLRLLRRYLEHGEVVPYEQRLDV